MFPAPPASRRSARPPGFARGSAMAVAMTSSRHTPRKPRRRLASTVLALVTRPATSAGPVRPGHAVPRPGQQPPLRPRSDRSRTTAHRVSPTAAPPRAASLRSPVAGCRSLTGSRGGRVSRAAALRHRHRPPPRAQTLRPSSADHKG
jgi:hypothetical protein